MSTTPPAGAAGSSISPFGRSGVARLAVRAVNAVSRRLGVGSGTVAGGRVGLAIDPGLLAKMSIGRPVALVSGTNGKTTTTRLLAVALSSHHRGSVVTNATGSNMPAGHVAALAQGDRGSPVVLEVDEGYLPGLLDQVRPAVVVLLNLSRDQLDRTSEVRMLAGRWRAALAPAQGPVVVANADDPLVVWGAQSSSQVVWVAAGMRWRADATGCPACEGRITFVERAGSGPDAVSWSCTCGFARPEPAVWLEEPAPRQRPVTGPSSGLAALEGSPDDLAPPPEATVGGTAPGESPSGEALPIGATARWADGTRLPVVLQLPGRFNLANATMAAVAAATLGVPAAEALSSMAEVTEVAGRFTTKQIGGVATRLLLAKNPAGWGELLELVVPTGAPVVVGINARVADGRDPSWLWDVPFERLAGRRVVATGDRWADLSVRLHYAEVEHQAVPDPASAVAAAAAGSVGGGRQGRSEDVEFIGNYTAFRDLLER